MFFKIYVIMILYTSMFMTSQLLAQKLGFTLELTWVQQYGKFNQEMDVPDFQGLACKFWYVLLLTPLA